jgi:bacillithiol system protein YtxJ
MINWKKLNSINNLEEALKNSFFKNILIFKHSTRCIISKTVLRNFENESNKGAEEKIDFYFLDLLDHRDVSNEIANRLNVEHQSPQLLLISKGVCVFNTSHEDISFKQIENLEIKV